MMAAKNSDNVVLIGKHLLIAWLYTFFVTPGYTQPSVKAAHQYASRIWYNKPSINWNEAVPIGNGRMGAMVYGAVQKEHIQLNEQTLWSGAPSEWNNPQAQKYLPLVRQAALTESIKQRTVFPNLCRVLTHSPICLWLTFILAML